MGDEGAVGIKVEAHREGVGDEVEGGERRDQMSVDERHHLPKREGRTAPRVRAAFGRVGGRLLWWWAEGGRAEVGN